MSTRSPDELLDSWGYHPQPRDLVTFVLPNLVRRLLLIGAELPDVLDQVDAVRQVTGPELGLPKGIFWFGRGDGLELIVVSAGTQAAAASSPRLDPVEQLGIAYDWLQHLWPQAQALPAPKYAIGEPVIVTSGAVETLVQRRSMFAGSWTYEVRLRGVMTAVSESALNPLPIGDDVHAWVKQEPASADRFAATLTRAKLKGNFTDTVMSFRATRTLFRPYQFKPVIKFLQSGKSRILIADEVGLGKTIEAGLLWTELEARRSADRVLVVCPAGLVGKWRMEMATRFGFELREFTGEAQREFEERVESGRLPSRYAYVASLERLRKWSKFADFATVMPQFDLIIVDESHSMRNVGTKSHALGSVLSELTDAFVFLSATPVNLRSTDLFNLVDLLTPGEFASEWSMEAELAPNAKLLEIERALVTRTSDSQRTCLVLLDSLDDGGYGSAILARPEAGMLRSLLTQASLSARDIARARQLLAGMNALSATVTRTRKVEVDTDKVLRSPKPVQVEWTQQELDFYREYLVWCESRAEEAGVVRDFAMQMPLRLASACLPVARDQVLKAGGGDALVDEDGEDDCAKPAVVPHRALIRAAEHLQNVDTKFDMLEPIVREFVSQGRRALLFTFSKPTLRYLANRLKSKARVAVLNGDVKQEQRRQIMADFRAGEYDLLLANRVASEGLDFEFCSAVINYDLPWNPMEVEQRIGRIDRIGQQEEQIIIANFFNEATIDERILYRLYERIGVFERSIGPLEPILMEHKQDLVGSLTDFSLTDEQRLEKAQQAMVAIEAQTLGREALTDASSFLMLGVDDDVLGLQDKLVKSGRYVGQLELARLLDDWARHSGQRGVTISGDRRLLSLTGNERMIEQLESLVTARARTMQEVSPYIQKMRGGFEIHVVLDPELARAGTGELLNAGHPLVLAALTVPEYRLARFSKVRVHTSDSIAVGTYFVQLAQAEWAGVRPGKEIWAYALDDEGHDTDQDVAGLLLAALASGDLHPSDVVIPDGVLQLAAATDYELQSRRATEQLLREEENQALLTARRMTVEHQHTRKMQSIRDRLETSKDRGRSRGEQLFEAQLLRAAERHRLLVEKIDASTSVDMVLTPLAACILEVVPEGA